MKAWQVSHVVNNSWLPIMMSSAVFGVMLITLFFFKMGVSTILLMVSLSLVLLLFSVWFRDTSRESTFQGNHTSLVQSGLKWGLVWFLFSEVWFFFSIFWSFFHFSVAPLNSGLWEWPFLGINAISPFQVPLLNTLILLMSGLTATLAHQELLSSKKSFWVFYSMLLGGYFLTLQAVEYLAATFMMSSGAFGSIFFFGTGFHGLHVCLGAIMLAVSSIRILLNFMTSQHHFSLEFSLWYWHFVDVVWLFLFFWVYTWGY